MKIFYESKKLIFLYPIIGAFTLPIIIGLLKPSLLSSVDIIIFLSALYLPMVIILRIIYDWTTGESFFGSLFRYIIPLPPGIVYSNDLKNDKFPWITVSIIFLNSFIFLAASESFLDDWVFPPYGNPSIIQIIISLFTSAFLHANFSHLFGNMVFLWAFGSAVETRVGAIRFVSIYILSIITSKVLVLVLLNIQSNFLNTTEIIGYFHSLGASGAISGIMGLFVVRCFFAQLSVSIPFLFLPFISTSIKVQGTVLIGIFFAMDLDGGFLQFLDDSSGVNYWSHVGGYLAGFAMGYVLGQQKNAYEESIKFKAYKLNQERGVSKKTTEQYEKVLINEPENESALKYFFDLHKYNQQKAEHFFVRLLQVTVKRNFKQALELFNEYFPNFINALPGDILLRFGLYFYNNADLSKARILLEFSSEKEGSWQAKASLTLGLTLQAMGNQIQSKQIFQSVMAGYPNSPFYDEAYAQLSKLGIPMEQIKLLNKRHFTLHAPTHITSSQALKSK
jgi:membrane associated rhomboid family serine protease